MSETWNPPWVLNSSLLTIQGMSASGLTVFPMGNPPLGATAFTPSSLTGLILWLDADAITGVSSGASLSAWTDSSASASHATQPTGAKQPIYRTGVQNGRAALEYFGAQALNSTTSNSQGFTTAFASKITNMATNPQVVGGAAATGAFAGGITANYALFAGVTLNGSSTTTTAWISIIGQFSGSSTTITVSGVTAFGDAGTGSAVKLGVGANSNGASNAHIGYLGEVLVYNRIVTETERASLDTYLRTRWATL